MSELIPYVGVAGELSTFAGSSGSLDGGPREVGDVPVWDGSGWGYSNMLENFNVKDSRYGAVGDGVTDDTAAFQEAIADAAAVGGQVFLPPGTYDSTLDGNDLDARMIGPGQLKDGGNNLRAPWFSHISAPPASSGFINEGVVTAFNGDLSKVQIAMEHRITGATTLGQPASDYVEVAEAAPFSMWLYNESGWNQSLATSAGGRTGVANMHLRAYQAGQGDVMCLNLGAVAASTKAGATGFLANPAVGLINGGMNAVVDGANMAGLEFFVIDNGFDVTGSGIIVQTARDEDTGALGTTWNGVRLQNIGSKAIDVGFMLTNSGSGYGAQVGLDLSSANFPAGATAWNQAAITLKAEQRIYFDATGTDAGAVSGIYRRPSGTGTTYIDYDGVSSMRHVVNGTATLQLTSTVVQANGHVNLASGKVLGVDNTQVVTSRRTGWAAPTGTPTRSTFDTGSVTLPQLAERVKALIDDLTTHGLIGA
jgi:hypothetical protein